MLVIFCHITYFLNFTSTGLFLLFLDAGSDGFVLCVNALASSDPAENATGFLAPALLEKPAGALRQEEEADELHQRWDDGQTQHVPAVRRERGAAEGRRNAVRDICLHGFSGGLFKATSQSYKSWIRAERKKWGCWRLISFTESLFKMSCAQ